MTTNDFEASLLRYFSPEQLEKIQRTRVGIAGAGGLGSNCAASLVRSGFKHLTLADFDVVELSNLNRQFYFADQLGMPKVEALKANLLRINAGAQITLVRERVARENAAEIFRDCDAVVEAFDGADAKKMIAETFAYSGKFYVGVSGIAGWGGSDRIVTRTIHSTFHMVGDGVSEVTAQRQPCAPRVAVAAAKEADALLAWVLG